MQCTGQSTREKKNRKQPRRHGRTNLLCAVQLSEDDPKTLAASRSPRLVQRPGLPRWRAPFLPSMVFLFYAGIHVYIPAHWSGAHISGARTHRRLIGIEYRALLGASPDCELIPAILLRHVSAAPRGGRIIRRRSPCAQ